jgi:hypothetical protein
MTMTNQLRATSEGLDRQSPQPRRRRIEFNPVVAQPLAGIRRSHALLLASAMALFLMNPSPSNAACAQWKISGNSASFQQSDGSATALNIGRRGTTLYGTADYSRSYLGKFLGVLYKGVDVNMSGTVEGVMVNSRLDFKIRWDNGSIGIYDLRIDEFGRLSGVTYDFRNPSNRANVIGYQPLPCLRG